MSISVGIINYLHFYAIFKVFTTVKIQFGSFLCCDFVWCVIEHHRFG